MISPVHFLIMAVLMMAAFGAFSTAVAMTPKPLLPNCPAGTYLATSPEGRDICLPCQTGTYMDEYARKKSCKKHRVCKNLEKILIPGTSTANVVCTCKSGERRFYNVDERYGYDCRLCKEGTIRQNVVGPFDEGDTGCCAPDTQAIRDKLGKLRCQQLGRVTPLDFVITTSAPEVSIAETMPWWLYFIIAALTTFVITLIIIFIATVVEKRRQRRQVTLLEEGQSLTLNKSPP